MQKDLRACGRKVTRRTFGAGPATLNGAGEPLRLSRAAVTPELFDVLRVKPALGRAFEGHEERVALPTSLMPNNLPEQMTPQEFLDLLAYLSERK